MYSLFKGFKKLGEFKSILEAKKNAPNDDGVYNLINRDINYRSSWQMLNGCYYGD